MHDNSGSMHEGSRATSDFSCPHTDTAVCTLIWQDEQASGTDMRAGDLKSNHSSRARYSTAVDIVGGSSYPSRQKMAPNRSPTLMA